MFEVVVEDLYCPQFLDYFLFVDNIVADLQTRL